jgi:hypothetical protein
LIVGLLGGIPLALVFGFVALRQIKARGQGGRGIAIAGIVLAGAWALLVVVGIVLALTQSADRDSTGAIRKAGDVSTNSLRVGDCIESLSAGTDCYLSVPGVPCRQPHAGEVYATFNLAGSDYPGDTKVHGLGDDGCAKRISALTGGADNVILLRPTRQSWDSRDDRQIVCVAIFNPKRVGSATTP